MAVLYSGYMFTKGEDKTYQFVFTTFVSNSILMLLYDKFIKEDIPNIGKLSETRKKKYWDIASKYFTDTKERINAVKVIYVLSLITNSDEEL